MSETEKLRRSAFKRNRKIWITVQTVIVVLLTVAVLASAIAYQRIDQTYYIGYTEDANVDYKVYLKDNNFYEEEYLGAGQSYVSSLIDKVVADLEYEMDIQADGVEYEYSYKIDTVMTIKDKSVTVLEKVYPVKPLQSFTESQNKVTIKEQATLDYTQYNEFASKFFEDLNLNSSRYDSTLSLVMTVNVKGASDELAEDAANTYRLSLDMPLVLSTMEIQMQSSVPTGENKVVASVDAIDTTFFMDFARVGGVIDALLILILVAFIFLTRNHDINYDIKVRRILRNYRSFIQIITREFNADGYQTVAVTTFGEMLGIRDTVMSPILMFENEDQTMTRFYIPASTSLLYIFDIKVDNFDEIYGSGDDDGEIIPLDPDPTDPTDPEPTPDPVDEVDEAVEASVAPVEIVEEPVSDVNVSDESVVDETVEEAPAEETVSDEPVADETVEEVAPVSDETVADETIAEVAPVEEPIVEETIVEETAPVSDETVADEAVSDKPVADEAPVEAPAAAAPFIPELVELGGEEDDEDGATAIAYVGADNTLINIRCSRSFLANVIQSGSEIKGYYDEIKNYILSFKGVKARISWRLESYKKGRIQLFKMKIRGKAICLYCALDPDEFDNTRYFQERADAKAYELVPMMVKIKSERGLKRAMELVDAVMGKYEMKPDKKFERVDYVAEHPYESTKALVAKGHIKLLNEDGTPFVAPTPAADTETPVTDTETSAMPAPVTEEVTIIATDDEVDTEAIDEAMSTPTTELKDIDYVDEAAVEEFIESEEASGVEVIGVVWPERPARNKIYRYDPNGEKIETGDIVLVPTHDASKGKDVVRKAAVAYGNRKVDPASVTHPLKKVIGIVKRTLENALTPKIGDDKK